MTTARLELPPKLIPVFSGKALYRGAYGGRGSGKTRTFAVMTAVKAYQFAQEGRRGVILCGREFMNSLADSSFAEVATAIRETPWLDTFFEIGEEYIRTRDRRVSFAFSGLRHNIDSLKSKARILLAWIDEAENVSEKAWTKLLPTIREEGAEVWITWNPETEGSATDTRWRKSPPPGSKIVEINHGDNPWFPERLRVQMEDDRRRDPAKARHIWDGEYLANTEALIFRNWVVEEFEPPKDATFYFGADWGFSADPTTLVRFHLDGRRLLIDYEAYQVGCEIDRLPALFDAVPESRRWRIVADSARPETISYLKRAGFHMAASVKGAGSVEDGISFLQSFDIVVHPRCKHTIKELGLYSYKVDPRTDEITPVPKDEHNHCIDALRYGLERVRKNASLYK